MDIKKLIDLYDKQNTIADTAREYCKLFQIEYSDSFRRKVSKILSRNGLTNDNTTESNDYKNLVEEKSLTKTMNAFDENGKLMNIDQYCEYYGLDRESVRSYKLVSHTGVPYFNIVFNDVQEESTITEEEFKETLKEFLESSPKFENKQSDGKRGTGVVKIADLHLGSYVDNLIRTKDFSIDILCQKLKETAQEINKMGYSKVHVHILGDILESFTAKSHANTWKGLDKKMAGAEAVKLSVKVLNEYLLNNIENLGEVKIVAGNHDRITSDNKDDVQGEAANMIAWGLELLGYNVEFNPLVITHIVDNICHILTHGHHGISKKTTKQLCWDYGIKGKFNLICEGHLHSIIQRLSVVQRDSFKTVTDDAVDHRRMNCPSYFTGNFFSESLGYTSESGFLIVEDNGKGVPNVFNYAV